MNKNKKIILGTLASAVLLAGSCGVNAQGDVAGVVGNGSDVPVCQALSDQVHLLTNALTNKYDVHCYSFQAIRGQKVLLVNQMPDTERFMKIEYSVDGQWRTRSQNETTVVSDLNPGDSVKVRVTHRHDQPYQAASYKLSFGSYPIMSDVTLIGPPVVNRVPVADTGWVVGLQTHGELTYQLQYSDSVGAPLKGSQAVLTMYSNLKAEEPDLYKVAPADDAGKARLTFKLDKCYSGEHFSERNDIRGTHYWLSNYNVVRWFVYDGYIGPEDLKEKSKVPAAFAHICSQQLNRGRAGRW
ncbi:hypothetical protein AABC73_22865 [Pseudomonas sp. G.S.17]|uniref:hypothetical protein n=1 Tax=Pseudomonas sp. G.S.17 TaxID=3137451 RepID=UPI00311CD2F2